MEKMIMTEQEKLKIYDDALEEWPSSTEALKGAYACLVDSLENYVEQVQLDAFMYGYEVGRKAGK